MFKSLFIYILQMFFLNLFPFFYCVFDPLSLSFGFFFNIFIGVSNFLRVPRIVGIFALCL